MTSEDIADRIAQLDWSGTSLQHQLVMSAAVMALRGVGWEVAEVENPVGEMRLLLEDLLRHRDVTVCPNKSALGCE